MFSEWGQAILVFLAAILLCKLVIDYINQPSNLPPGPWGIPFLGYLPFLGTAHHISLQEVARKYGTINSFYLGKYLVIHLSSFEAIKEAFLKQGDNFAGRPFFMPFRCFNNDYGIITAEGNDFRAFKSFILQTLKDAGAQKNKLEIIVKDNAEDFMKYLHSLKSKPTDVLDALGVSVATTYTVLLFDKRFDKFHPWIKTMVSLFYREQRCYGNGARIYLPWLRHVPWFATWIGETELREVKKGIHKHLDMQVQEAEKDYTEGSKKNFVHAWLTEERNRKIKDPNDDLFKRYNMRVNMDFIFSAGYETTVTSLRWTLVYLMLHPDVQEQLIREIDEVIGKERTPSMDDEPRMPYTQATIQEVHRFSAVEPLGVVHKNREETTLCGYFIPKNSYILPNILAVHLNPVRYPEPETFRPERYIDSKGKFIKDDNVLSFSMGKRACPGEPLAQVELFLYITYLLQNFTVKNPEDQVLSLDRNPSISANPKSFSCIFIPRQ